MYMYIYPNNYCGNSSKIAQPINVILRVITSISYTAGYITYISNNFTVNFTGLRQ